MFTLIDLHRRIIAAPMAGGPSTPALAHAVTHAGGLGFLAGGYKTSSQIVEEIETVRASGTDLFGVNLFVPEREPCDLVAAAHYREQLAALASAYDVELPQPQHDDDGWKAKIEMLLDLAVPVVSFTFGCPTADIIRRFHSTGTATFVSITTLDEALHAKTAGATGLIVQGPAAGGHRATFRASREVPQQSLEDLHAEVRAKVDLEMAVAGGISTADDVERWLEHADAVQLGTAFLDADEAGTKPAHRAALRDARFTRTAMTSAFSGRMARGLANEFMQRFDPTAPISYPAVNQLTAPIRAAAARSGNAEHMSLWAGTGWRSAATGPAQEIVGNLLP